MTKNAKSVAAELPLQTNDDQSLPTKIAGVLTLLHRDKGASLSELSEATGWQEHTARAALTGLKKKGHTIERTKAEEGVSRYRITGAAGQ